MTSDQVLARLGELLAQQATQIQALAAEVQRLMRENAEQATQLRAYATPAGDEPSDEPSSE